MELMAAEARCPDGAAVGIFPELSSSDATNEADDAFELDTVNTSPLFQLSTVLLHQTPPPAHTETHTHCQHQNLPSSPPHFSVSKIRGTKLKPGDAARQVSFLKHPTLVSMQGWPKTDIDNRSLINLYSSSSQSFPLLSACLLGGILSSERYLTSWTCSTLSKQKIEHVVGSR